MKYIDLHVHSNASDGTLTPSELVEKAITQGLSAFALTDHDTVHGIEEAVSAAKEAPKKEIEIEIIPGIELSLAYKGRDIHMLGLFVEYKNESFCKTLQYIKEEREDRNNKMAGNLAKAGIDISMEQLKQDDKNAIITRAHFAKYLVKTGVVKSNQEAFQKYLSDDGPYYVPRQYLSPKNGIELIKSAGGIPILAHPLLYKLSNAELDKLIGTLKNHGLVGIETIYSANTGFDEGYIKKFAHKYELLITGGSDYHGANKPLIELGVGKGNLKIPYSILEELEKYLSQERKLNNAGN